MSRVEHTLSVPHRKYCSLPPRIQFLPEDGSCQNAEGFVSREKDSISGWRTTFKVFNIPPRIPTRRCYFKKRRLNFGPRRRPREGEYMKAVNIFTVGVVGLRQLPGVLLLSVCTFVSASIPSLGGDPDMGEGERAGRSPDLVNR